MTSATCSCTLAGCPICDSTIAASIAAMKPLPGPEDGLPPGEDEGRFGGADEPDLCYPTAEEREREGYGGIKRGQPAYEASDKVRIWSGDRHAWWREHGRGYTTDREAAGIYDREDAVRRTAHCGPEKGIRIEPVDSPAGADSGEHEYRHDVRCRCVGQFGPNPDCGACGGDGVVSARIQPAAFPEAPAQQQITDEQVQLAVNWLAANEPSYYRAWKDLDLTRSINPLIRKLLEAGR